MTDYEHDGCVHCMYEGLSEIDMPCRACKYTINHNNMFRNKAADMYEPIKPAQKSRKLPDKINRPEFERQIESLSIKSFIQQLKYLACKINEILTYLEDDDGEESLPI